MIERDRDVLRDSEKSILNKRKKRKRSGNNKHKLRQNIPLETDERVIGREIETENESEWEESNSLTPVTKRGDSERKIRESEGNGFKKEGTKIRD